MGKRKPWKPVPTKHIICFICRGDGDKVKPQHVHDFNWAGCQCRHPNHGLPKDKR